MNKKKIIISIIIFIFFVLIFLSGINFISSHIGKNAEILKYMENKYGEEFVLDSKTRGFPSFMYSYFEFYGHAKKDKTMTFTGEYDFDKEDGDNKIRDNYDVTLFAKQKSNELKIELDKYFKEDYEIMCFPKSSLWIIESYELESLENNYYLDFVVFAKPSDYEKIKEYKNGVNNEIDSLLNNLKSKYSNIKSKNYKGEYDYSSIDFIKTKDMRNIRNNTMTVPLDNFDYYDYVEYVYKDKEGKFEEHTEFIFDGN